ncbi:MAG: hypothetical protein ABFD69_13800 [Candidatus Sumerlaeia bacterium]
MLHSIRFALAFLILNAVIPMRAGAIQQFYGIDDIETSRSVDAKLVSEINQKNKTIGWTGAPLNPAAILHGGNSISIAVFDEQTSRPITDYVIHGVVLGRRAWPDELDHECAFEDRSNAKKYTKFHEEAVGIGRLESKKIHDPAGKCGYDQLGKLEVEFQVCADDHVTSGVAVKIPDDGTSLTICLTQSATIRGRVLGLDGEPAKNLTIEVKYDGRRSFWHTGYDYAARTGDDGSFMLAVQPDDYALNFPEIPRSNSEIDDVIRKRVRAEAEASGRDWTSEERNRREAELTSEPLVVPPATDRIHLAPGQKIDLGTLSIKKAPVVEVRLIGPDGQPMANYPFEILYTRFRTDSEGNARLALAGCSKPGEAALFAPEALGNRYQAKRLKAPKRTPDPILTMSDKEYYDKTSSSPMFNPGNELPAKFDDLTVEQRQSFHEQYEKERGEIRERIAAEAARPDHPNYQIFKLQPGETSKVTLVFKQPPGASNPRLLIRDRATGKPVEKFRGVVAINRSVDRELLDFDYQLKWLNYHWVDSWLFQSADLSGRVSLTGVTLPETLLREPRVLAETPHEPSSPVHVVIDAPGYARQSFDLTVDKLQSGDELVFDLEPEASVTGRLVIAGTGEPLTKDTLKAYLIGKNQWNKKIEDGLKYSFLGVRLENNCLEGRYLNSDRQHFAFSEYGRIGDDGRFEIHGLRPDDKWGVRIEIDGLPKISSIVTLKPGANDLGDFKIGGEGYLAVTVLDETGAPLPGVYLKWPLGIDDADDDSDSDEVKAQKNNPVSDETGTIVFPMRPLKTDREIVRLIPPWGLNRFDTDRSCPRVMFDAVMNIDRGAEKTIEARLERGHRLVIELPLSPGLDEIIRAATGMSRPQYGGKPRPTFFGISSVFLQATKPNAQGFVYRQRFMPNDGIAITTASASTTIGLDDIPPGRYHLCVVGSKFTAPSHPEYADSPDTATRERYQNTGYTMALPEPPSQPLAIMEFEMLPKETSVQIGLSDTAVEIALENPEAMPLKDTVVFMDRTEPLSTEFGGDTQRILAMASFGSPVRQVEKITTSMVGFMEAFIEPETFRTRPAYRPALFRAVPPGSYTIKVYQDVNDAIATPPKVYFQKTIQVPRNGGKIQVSVPK